MDGPMNRVLMIAVIGEAITGVLLLFAPGLVATLLLGTDVTGPGLIVARVAGIALIALSVACLPGRASQGMLIYGLLVTLYLGWLGVTQAAAGLLLWPAVGLHAVLAVLLSVNLNRQRRPS